MRRTLMCVLCATVLLLWAGAAEAWTTSDAITFCRYGPKTGMTTTFYLWSPSRSSSDPYTETFITVTSKWDQPRTSGTNPHQGVDVGADYGTALYPIWQGWVEYANDTSTYEMILYLDLDADHVKDDACWAKYDHISDVASGISVGTYVSATDLIGASGDEAGVYPAHLHFGAITSYSSSTRTGKWAPMERYYTFASSWNYGKHLDFICTLQRNVNTMKATAYAYTGSYEYLSAGKVKLYHRLAGTTSWTAATMTLVTGSQITWQFNLGSIYSAGQSVQYMVIAERSLGDAYYRWGIFPAKFERPPALPPDSSWSYDYLTVTIQ